MPAHIPINHHVIATFCRKWHVAELGLFGSVLRDDFRSDSDVDVLVTFEPDAGLGLFEFVRMGRELSEILGRHVDLVERAGLKPALRQEILATTELLYAA
jgi:predicted nucleotidyltransferase